MDLKYRVLRREGPQDRLLVLLHGYAMGPASVLRHVERLDPDANYLAVAPRAPFKNSDAKSIWFEPLTRRASGDQLLESIELADDFVDEMCAEHDLQREEAVVGGFSQGASLAAAVALRPTQAPRLAGCVAWCGLLTLPQVDIDWDGAREVPIHLQAGTDDDVLPIQITRAGVRAVAEQAVSVEYFEYACGHEIPRPGTPSAASWLEAVYNEGAVPAHSDLSDRLADAPGIDSVWALIQTELESEESA